MVEEKKAEPVIKTKKVKKAKLHNRVGYGRMPNKVYVRLSGKNDVKYIPRAEAEKLVSSLGGTFMKRQAAKKILRAPRA